MNYYRCYLLDGDDHIASAKILKCRDDHDANQQCRDVLAASDRYAGAEIWDSARYVYRYPEDTAAVTAETLHRKGQMGTRDQALTDALGAQLGADRRCMLEADAVKAARLREQCLERHAQIERLMRRGFLGTRTRRCS
jgi:hypothetical protein